MKTLFLIFSVLCLGGGAAHIATQGMSTQRLFHIAQQKGADWFGLPAPLQDTGWIRRQKRDIAYGPSPAQKIDLYLPNEGEGPFPTLFFIHGGAFMMGDKADGQLNAALGGVKRGYAVVSVNYRLSGEAPFPAAVQDVKAALRLIRIRAEEFRLDATRIAAWGGSAGGNLAAMLGTSSGNAEFDDASLGNPGVSTAVKAVICWFPALDFLAMDAQFKASGKGRANHSEADSPESRYLGQPIATVPDKAKAADPASYLDPSDPPFFIQHGDADALVPTEQSIVFAARARAVLGEDKVVFSLLPGAGHGDPAFETPQNLEKVFAFLDRHLK